MAMRDASIRLAHAEHYRRTFGAQLDAARRGDLSFDWREQMISSMVSNPRIMPLNMPHSGLCAVLSGESVTPQRRPAPPTVRNVAHTCLMRQRGGDDGPLVESQDLSAAWACAALDVAHRPPAEWEPYAAAGDWRRALDAWYCNSTNVLESVAARWELGADVNGIRDDPAVDPQPLRDQLEASYRAGLAAGTGADNGWLDWFADRIERWHDRAAVTITAYFC